MNMHIFILGNHVHHEFFWQADKEPNNQTLRWNPFQNETWLGMGSLK